MPIYEFKCLSCGRPFEELVRRAGEPVRCPTCGGAEAERRLSVFGLSGEANRRSANACLPQGAT